METKSPLIPPSRMKRREGKRDGGRDGCVQRTDLTNVQMDARGMFSYFPRKEESPWPSRWSIDLVTDYQECTIQNPDGRYLTKSELLA